MASLTTATQSNTETPNEIPNGLLGDPIAPGRKAAGRALIWGASILLGLVILVQALSAADLGPMHFDTWRPALYTYVLWAIAIGAAQVMIRGEAGQRALFILPAALFTVAVVIFPTFFGLYIAFTDWNLSSFEGRRFNGIDNLIELFHDAFYWKALGNMVFYVAMVLVEYAIAFGLALLLNADIRARKFFRVTFLIPFMLSPVAVSWMVGKSLMEVRFGPLAGLAKELGWSAPNFFGSAWAASFSIEALDAWVSIPFIMILLLAGLQAMPKEVQEAARVDGATPWQSFWKITFPLMLPVSATAVVLRIIFKLKLADIIINMTYGGPGGATDSVSSYIFRQYRDRSNVGYGTMLAMFYLVLIIIFITLLLNFVSKHMKKVT